MPAWAGLDSRLLPVAAVGLVRCIGFISRDHHAAFAFFACKGDWLTSHPSHFIRQSGEYRKKLNAREVESCE